MPVCKRGRHKVQIILYNERIHPAVWEDLYYIYTATKATKEFVSTFKGWEGSLKSI